jgi:ATP-dependent Clp protease protease subunit
MIKFILSAVLTFTASVCLGQQTATPKITLSKSNTLALQGPVTYSSVAQLQQKLVALSNSLSKNSTIYLYLDTPGGSVGAGMALIDTLKSIPQEVVTVTSFAASMGFITVQSLGRRVILPNATLMSHRARGGVSGQIPGEMTTRSAWIHKTIEDIERDMAKRMKMSLASYQKLILNEYWVVGKHAIKDNAADVIANVVCDSSLEGTQIEKIYTFFGVVKLTMSKCPLVSAPLAFDFEDTNLWMLDPKERIKAENAIKMPYLKKKEFVEQHSKNGDVGVYL